MEAGRRAPGPFAALLISLLGLDESRALWRDFVTALCFQVRGTGYTFTLADLRSMGLSDLQHFAEHATRCWDAMAKRSAGKAKGGAE